MSEARKLKKGDRLIAQGIEKTCHVIAVDSGGLSFIEHGLGRTGIVTWPKGEFEDGHPKPEPINHLLK